MIAKWNFDLVFILKLDARYFIYDDLSFFSYLLIVYVSYKFFELINLFLTLEDFWNSFALLIVFNNIYGCFQPITFIGFLSLCYISKFYTSLNKGLISKISSIIWNFDSNGLQQYFETLIIIKF